MGSQFDPQSASSARARRGIEEEGSDVGEDGGSDSVAEERQLLGAGNGQPNVSTSQRRSNVGDEAQLSGLRSTLKRMRDHVETCLALSLRLSAIPGNDLAVNALAWDLKEALIAASEEMVEADETLHRCGDSALPGKFGRLLRRIKRHRREEERELAMSKAQPASARAIDDWLDVEKDDLMVLSKRRHGPASRYVVTNPFTVLGRLCAGIDLYDHPPPKSKPRASPRRRVKADLGETEGQLWQSSARIQSWTMQERILVCATLMLIPIALIAIIVVSHVAQGEEALATFVMSTLPPTAIAAATTL